MDGVSAVLDDFVHLDDSNEPYEFCTIESDVQIKGLSGLKKWF